MKISQVEIGKIKPYNKNPRKNQAAVASVSRSIQEFGWQQPIVVDESMVIIAGHTRYLAAKKLGIKVVPVHVASGLSPEKARAYRLADNRTAEISKWDNDLKRDELAELLGDGFSQDLLESLGFTEDEMIASDDELLGSIKIEERRISPFTKTHVLLSFPPERMVDIQDALERIKNLEFVEYVQSSN